MPFDNGIKYPDEKNTIDFLLSDYLALVDETGRILRDDKPGAIPESLSPILERLKFKPQNWLDMLKGLERKFSYAIGNTFHLTNFSTEKKKKRSIKGWGFAKRCYQLLAA